MSKGKQQILIYMKNSTENLYQLDGRVPIGKALPFGLQHVLAMFVSNITPIMILAGAVGLDSALSATLIQNCMVIAGIGTLVQLFPIWRVGSRLPIVMGISFTFLSLAIGIAGTYGMGTLVGAVIVGGIVEGLLGLFVKYWIKLIPHVVSATVVTAIGFSLLPIGANSFAGGLGSADFGSMNNWIVGSVTLLACLLCQVFAKGFLRSLSVLVGLVVGYVLACFMGMVDFSRISGMSLLALPRLLPFTPEFNIGAILSVVAVYLVSATETIGDTSALCNSALKRDPETKEMGSAICCDGFVSSVSGLFGCTPITSFSQNVGLVSMTKVVNRGALATGAIFLILCGLIPKLGALVSIMPQAVLGGAAVMMFSSIVVSGIQLITKEKMTPRTLTIVSVALGVGYGMGANASILAHTPQFFQLICGESGIVPAAFVAIVLNVLLPKDDKAE